MKGNLTLLRRFRGLFTTTVQECVVDDLDDTFWNRGDDDPPPGEGQWFPVRGHWISGVESFVMTYDTLVPDLDPGTGQQGVRDEQIGSSGDSCP